VCLPGFAENLCEFAEDDTSVFELPLIPYACISRCILCLGFVCSRLKDYSSALFFKLPLLSPGLFLFFVVLRPVLVRERFTSGMGF
jgi:hypothetical protein